MDPLLDEALMQVVAARLVATEHRVTGLESRAPQPGPKGAAGAGRFDLGGGRTSGLVVRLNAPWQVEFLGTGQRAVDGGTLVGGAGGQPVASTPGTQVLLNRPADAFGVATSGSIGPTAAEIAEAVWAKVLV